MLRARTYLPVSLLFLATFGFGFGFFLIPLASAITGLDFPGSAAVSTTMRFQFTGSNAPAIYPATYIWRAYPRQQAGYYTTFFWSTTGSDFWWDSGSPNSYYGAHPYPQVQPLGNTHYWEIATDFGGDFFGNPPQTVQYNRWYTQALVAWNTGSGKRTMFYWDLPDTSKVIDVTVSSSFGNKLPPNPGITWGDAPWTVPGNPNAGSGHEVYDGIIRGISIYNTNLSVSDIISESNAPMSTSAGSANIWYLNQNPTPNDISDKSGKGHNPSWVGSERPGLYTDGQTTPPGAPTNLLVK
jgi:hypothetical protein